MSFDWDTYLRKHEAVAAPKECFLQVSKVVSWFELLDMTYLCVYVFPIIDEMYLIWWKAIFYIVALQHF